MKETIHHAEREHLCHEHHKHKTPYEPSDNEVWFFAWCPARVARNSILLIDCYLSCRLVVVHIGSCIVMPSNA